MKKTKVEGFARPLDLDYRATDVQETNDGNYLSVYTFNSSPSAAINRYQWQPFSKVAEQRFSILQVTCVAYAETVALVPLAIFDFRVSLLLSPNGFNISYPAGLFEPPQGVPLVNYYEPMSASGNPQNKEIQFSCGNGVIVNAGETLTFDFQAYKSAAWAVTDLIYVRMSMLWK
jgi:hypothetical protein